MASHSLGTLEILHQFDDFLESIHTVADVGCGTGEDITWWATLKKFEDPPKPYNFNCFAVDIDGSKLAQIPDLKNINKVNRDFSEEYLFPVSIDFMWAHDSLQYSTNPLLTLRRWNEAMTVNGMMILSVPQHSGVEFNKYYSRTYSNCYYHYTPTMLLYMLAVNGFDCRDAYLLKKFQDPWINIAVYKTDIAPMDPAKTTWYDLVETNLLHPSIVTSVNKHGCLRQEEVVMPWLDRENYFIDYVSVWSEPFPDMPPAEKEGVFNISIPSKETTLLQRATAVKTTPLLKPIGVMRPPKK